jgi:glutamate dehydrogenase/leucine dehydrogenase
MFQRGPGKEAFAFGRHLSEVMALSAWMSVKNAAVLCLTVGKGDIRVDQKRRVNSNT